MKVSIERVHPESTSLIGYWDVVVETANTIIKSRLSDDMGNQLLSRYQAQVAAETYLDNYRSNWRKLSDG